MKIIYHFLFLGMALLNSTLTASINPELYSQLEKSRTRLLNEKNNSLFLNKDTLDLFDHRFKLLNKFDLVNKVALNDFEFIFYSNIYLRFYVITKSKIYFLGLYGEKPLSQFSDKYQSLALEKDITKDMSDKLKIIQTELNAKEIDYKKARAPSTTRRSIYHLFWKNEQKSITSGYLYVPAYVLLNKKEKTDADVTQFNMISVKLDVILEPFLKEVEEMFSNEFKKEMQLRKIYFY